MIELTEQQQQALDANPEPQLIDPRWKLPEESAWFKTGRFRVTLLAGPGAANSGRSPLVQTVFGR